MQGQTSEDGWDLWRGTEWCETRQKKASFLGGKTDFAHKLICDHANLHQSPSDINNYSITTLLVLVNCVPWPIISWTQMKVLL